MVVIFIPPRAEAGNDIQVNMWEAYYADADNDGAADDIVVKYNITIPFNTGDKYTIELYCKLILPSGAEYIHEVAIVTTAESTVTQYWFNAASESGWYTYSVYAYTIDSSLNPGYNEIIFDPPGGDPGDPLVDTTVIGTTESQG